MAKKSAPKKTAKKTAPKKTAKKAAPKKNAKKTAKKTAPKARRKYVGAVGFVAGGQVLKATRCVLVLIPDLHKKADVEEYIGNRYVKTYGKECSAKYVKCEDPQAVYDSFVSENVESLAAGTSATYVIGSKNMTETLKGLAEVTTAARITFDEYVPVESAEESAEESGEETAEESAEESGEESAESGEESGEESSE